MQMFALPFAAVRGLSEQKINTNGGHAEFLARRLEEYQRTLRMMYGRVALSVNSIIFPACPTLTWKIL